MLSQVIQHISDACTALQFNLFSKHNSEVSMKGPCTFIVFRYVLKATVYMHARKIDTQYALKYILIDTWISCGCYIGNHIITFQKKL